MAFQRPVYTFVTVLMLLAFLTACVAPAPAPAKVEPTQVPAKVEPTKAPEAKAKYGEAPMLAELVKAGKLPPVDQRLPLEPMVNYAVIQQWIKPEVGKYGGTLRLLDNSAGGAYWGNDAFWIVSLAETMIQPVGLGHDPLNLHGRVLKGFDTSPDGKTYTLLFRKGMKWSDGQPFTTADFEFWYKDILLNDKLTPAGPGARWRSLGKPDGEVMKLEIVDQYTLKLSFPESYGGFASKLTDFQSWVFGLPPKHYMKQFHANYTPLEKLEPLIKEAGFEKGEWWRLFNAKGGFSKEQPRLSAYLLKEASETRWVWERNPYYYAVDAAGNQLPYIDRLVVEKTQDQAAADLKIIAGEADFVETSAPLESLAVYQQYAKEKGYRVLLLNSHSIPGDVALHFGNPDPVWQKFVNDVRFRRALSLAVDRSQINDAIYLKLAELPSTIPINKYDKAEANRLLGEIGLDKKDGEGCRLGPDGKRFTVPFAIPSDPPVPEYIPTAELVMKFWREVGICTRVESMSYDLYRKRGEAGELYASMYWHSYPFWPWTETQEFLGSPRVHPWNGLWAWAQYYDTGGKQGVAPPARYTELRKLYSEMQSITDPQRQVELWKQMKQILTDEIWFLPTIENNKKAVIISEKLGNVASEGYFIRICSNPQIWYYK